jgi:hypothetical protein
VIHEKDAIISPYFNGLSFADRVRPTLTGRDPIPEAAMTEYENFIISKSWKLAAEMKICRPLRYAYGGNRTDFRRFFWSKYGYGVVK